MVFDFNLFNLANINHLEKDHQYQDICIVSSWSDAILEEDNNHQISSDLKGNSNNLHHRIAHTLQILQDLNK